MPREGPRGYRRQRLNAQLQQELALALSRDVQDRRLQLVTVVEVDCAPDLSEARVRVSTLSEGEERRQELAALRGMTGYLRHLLGERLENLRRVPRLDFVWDDSIARGVRVSTLIHQLDSAREGGEQSDE